MSTQDRLAALIAAEQQADRLFAAVENNRLIRPGRTETGIDHDIYTPAEQSFGVRQHWHKRIVRAGPNTVRIFVENPPVHEIVENDTVFLDLARCSMIGRPMSAAPMSWATIHRKLNCAWICQRYLMP